MALVGRVCLCSLSAGLTKQWLMAGAWLNMCEMSICEKGWDSGGKTLEICCRLQCRNPIQPSCPKLWLMGNLQQGGIVDTVHHVLPRGWLSSQSEKRGDWAVLPIMYVEGPEGPHAFGLTQRLSRAVREPYAAGLAAEMAPASASPRRRSRNTDL